MRFTKQQLRDEERNLTTFEWLRMVFAAPLYLLVLWIGGYGLFVWSEHISMIADEELDELKKRGNDGTAT